MEQAVHLSSAIATFLSCGKPIKKSCELGIKYVNQAIKSNLNIGKGNGPINHLNSFKIKKEYKNEKCCCSRFTVGRRG